MLPSRFQRNSRLLRVLGAPGKDESRKGIACDERTGHALRQPRLLLVGEL